MVRWTRGLQWFALMTAVALCGIGTAYAQDVAYNALPGANFSQYKTYKWVTIEGAQHPDAITEQQIMQAIDAELATKGLTKTDDDKADLYVAYQVAVDQEKRLDSYSTGGVGWGWYGYRYPGMGGSTHTTTSTISIGTLSLDVYEAGAKQLVWRGRASKTLDPKAKPEKRQKNLAKAVKKLLKNFPPPTT
jgi:Domain of unknown function (DUF4136)